ncbi:MAG: type II secretion system F family protein [Clostridiales bacterium]|nr:type II secretion system F family protein [Clostridiales bacterium]
MGILSPMDIAALVIGVAVLAVWLFFYFQGRQYAAMFSGLEYKDYPMGDIYFVGYAMTKTFHVSYKSKQARKLRKELSAIYEPKYADYYLRIIYSMQFTMALTVACFAAPLYFLTGSAIALVAILAGSVGVYFYYGTAMEEKIKERSDEMLSDFSEVVSKLALLVNSGMILNEAWEKVSGSGDRILYQEMRRSVEEMQNGKSFTEALFEFGQRCMMPEIKKIASTLIQGLNQGNSELAPMLTQQSKEIWNAKKQMVRRKGEAANSMLLLPMCVTFIGILIMVMVPIFANLGT